jgi:hypothetical protein
MRLAVVEKKASMKKICYFFLGSCLEKLIKTLSGDVGAQN